MMPIHAFIYSFNNLMIIGLAATLPSDCNFSPGFRDLRGGNDKNILLKNAM